MIEEARVFHHSADGFSLTPDIKEACRYLGVKQTDMVKGESAVLEETRNLILESVKELQPLLHPQCLYARFPLATETYGTQEHCAPTLSFAGFTVTSKDLGVNLKNSFSVILMAATIGPQVDALIQRYGKINPAKGAAMQATAAMFIESYVDSINHMLKREALSQRMVLHPRYSPGYGDVSLEVQNIFFSLLPCTKIGLSLTDTLFMIPEKSVTAFIGIEHKNE